MSTRDDGPDGREDYGRLEGRWGDLLWSFVQMKRAIGYDYGRAYVWACERLCAFLGERDMDEGAFAEWAAPRGGEAAATRGKRIVLWNGFARFAQRMGADAAVVDVPVRYASDFVPHVYTADEAAAIFAAADAGIGQRRSGYEPDAIMPVFIRLLYSTGLRFCEAARLRWDDVDGRRVNIAKGKNGKARLVVLSASMAEVMEGYRALGVGDGGLVFCGSDGGPLQNQLVVRWHHKVLDACGIRKADGSHPRLHDWRHTFAVNALARMDAAGADVYVALPLLSRYMGHCGPRETELYLRLTDEGRARVLGAMESYAPGIAPQIGGLEDA